MHTINSYLKMNHGFIISLPRSGSTLLQRLLLANYETVIPPEPWLLLPLLMAEEESASRSVYGSKICARAWNDFFVGKRETKNEAIRSFYNVCMTGYLTESVKDSVFFDKTPRYTLIGPKLLELFPNSYYIVIWRNPVDIMLSMVNTWRKGRPMMECYMIDLIRGIQGWLEIVDSKKDGIIKVKYGDLCAEPIGKLKEIAAKYNLKLRNDSITSDLGDTVNGLGDPVGQNKFGNNVRKNSNSIKRKKVPFFVKLQIRRYLKEIPEGYFAAGNTSSEAMLVYLDSMDVTIGSIVLDGLYFSLNRLQRLMQVHCWLPGVRKEKRYLYM